MGLLTVKPGSLRDIERLVNLYDPAMVDVIGWDSYNGNYFVPDFCEPFKHQPFALDRNVKRFHKVVGEKLAHAYVLRGRSSTDSLVIADLPIAQSAFGSNVERVSVSFDSEDHIEQLSYQEFTVQGIARAVNNASAGIVDYRAKQLLNELSTGLQA